MFLDSLAIELHSTHRCLAVLKCLRSTYSWENVNLLDYVCHCFITNIIKGNSTYFNSALRDEDSGWQKENVMLLCIRKHLSLNLSRRNSVNCFFLPPQHNCRKCNSSGYCNILLRQFFPIFLLCDSFSSIPFGHPSSSWTQFRFQQSKIFGAYSSHSVIDHYFKTSPRLTLVYSTFLTSGLRILMLKAFRCGCLTDIIIYPF